MRTNFKDNGTPFGYTPNLTGDANKARVKITLMEMGLNPCQSALHKCPWDFLATDGHPGHVLRVKVKTVTRRRKGYFTYHKPAALAYDLLALVWGDRIGFHAQEALPPSAMAGDAYFSKDDLLDHLARWGLHGQV